MLETTIDSYSEKMRVAANEGRYNDSLALLEEFRSEVRNKSFSASEILDLLCKPNFTDVGSKYQLAFTAAWYNLSPTYVARLNALLADENASNVHEQVIELLVELGDESSVPALEKAMSYRWDFDEWLSIPKKSLQALNAIGTDRALEIVRMAAQSEIEEIKEEALACLDS